MPWKTKHTGTRHNEECKRVFSRYDQDCPRCIELMNGSKAREGWNDEKNRNYERWLKELHSHNYQQSNCGPICTAFCW